MSHQKNINHFIITSLICFFTNGLLLARNQNQPNTPAQIIQIETNIENANLLIAEQQLFKLQKSNISIKQKYHCVKLLEKIYLTQQNFNKYSVCNEQLVKIAKQLHPIYLSEAYAYKAYYWHTMMWGDSALIYSNESFQLAQKNRQFLRKIESSFVYEVYAITYLYRRTNLKTNCYQIEGLADNKPIQFQYFDSAIYYQEKYPSKFSSDKAMIYRSYANRWLDLVNSYRVFSAVEAKQLKPISWYAFKKADELYDKGLACLKTQHANDYFAIVALKSLNYTDVGKWGKGSQILDNAIHKYPIKFLLDRAKVAYQPFMNFMSYKVRNEMLLAYDAKKVDFDLFLLNNFKKSFWQSFIESSDLPYDQYRTSPYIGLFTLYRFKSLHEPNPKKSLAKGVSHLLTMKSYFHFIKDKIFLYQKSLPYFDVKAVQQRLEKDACFLFFQNDMDYLAGSKILITKNNIYFVKSKFRSKLSDISTDTLTFSEFKKISCLDFEENFKDVLKKIPHVKKVYLTYDDLVPYEILIDDTVQTNFASLPYLGQRINFVRIYDPIAYFSSKEYTIPAGRFDIRVLKQQNESKLLFMNDFFENFQSNNEFTNQQYSGNLKELLIQKGILHFYGHGELAINKDTKSKSFQFSYQKTGDLKSENQLVGDFKVNRDLVVLNNCFSGHPNFLINEFNRTIPLRILNNGAKAVISSPSKVDDFSSAAFFTLFYENIEKGMLYEDAFFEAKRTFFIEHPELRQPHYWNAFQLIQSYKMKNEVKNSQDSKWLLFSVFCLLDMFLFLAYFSKQKHAMIRHSA